MAGEPQPNPFSTRFTRPGDVAWQPLPETPAALLDRLDRLGGRAAICGPHGSGKSTLLSHLAVAAADRGWQPRLLLLRSAADVIRGVATAAATSPGGFIGIDGGELAGGLSRTMIRLAARQDSRMVVTMHRRPRSGGWPVLLEIAPNAEVFRRVVRSLLAGTDLPAGVAARFGPDLLAEVFDRHRGNFREALFELYDRFELAARK